MPGSVMKLKMVQADGSLTQTDDMYSVKLVCGMLQTPPMSLLLDIYGWCYGLCLEGVSSFVWCHVSPNLSLSESDCFRSAFAHLHLMTWVLMTYIKDTEVEHERMGRRSTSKQDLLSLFFFLILVDYLLLPLYFGDVPWLGGIHYLSLDALGTFFFLFWYVFPLCHVLSCYLNKCFCMISWFHVSL